MSVRDFTQNLDVLLVEFEDRLRAVVHSEVEFVQLIEEDLVTAGGKRVRPRLVFLTSNALGGVPGAMELALSVELLHSASLLHDDLVDDAETRRGKEAAFRKYGNAVSVLSGDYLLSRLMALLAQTGRMELVAMFAETARQLSEAEVLQFQVAALHDYSLANYERIIDGKTASVMRAACEGAAVLGGVPAVHQEALARFGSLYGQAFQMRDDYLDLMGTAEVLGKPAGGDVREGKVTLITLRLLEAYPGAPDYRVRPSAGFARATYTFRHGAGEPVVAEVSTSWSYVGAGLRLSFELLGPEYSMSANTLDTEAKLFLSREL
ncbi:polyprenyl synthetase family protein, partial [uncultured Meiothermus sp.]|uniref:polyprenyl synthetase family protein n=1 Tax=uncultured Meiothermus sp. TaxID=157471 RepID=UPI00262C7563